MKENFKLFLAHQMFLLYNWVNQICFLPRIWIVLVLFLFLRLEESNGDLFLRLEEEAIEN